MNELYSWFNSVAFKDKVALSSRTAGSAPVSPAEEELSPLTFSSPRPSGRYEWRDSPKWRQALFLPVQSPSPGCVRSCWAPYVPSTGQERPAFSPVLAESILISPACPCFTTVINADCHPVISDWRMNLSLNPNIHTCLYFSVKSIWPLLYSKFLVLTPLFSDQQPPEHRSPPSCRGCWDGGR